MLAQRSGVASPDEAFVAGMLHDIGIIVAMQVHPKSFATMIEALDSNEILTFCEMEETYLGASHDVLGAALCQNWKFPPNLIYATGHHHHPMESPERFRALPALINVSDVLAARLRIGYSRTVASDDLELDTLGAANVSEADIRFVETNLPDAVMKAQDVFSA
jgi:HD-like signal output (HDOD) protein